MDTATNSGPRYQSDMPENWLQDALDRKGMTQAQLARELTAMLGRSIDRAAVNKIAKAQRGLRADEAFAIVKLTGAELPPELTAGESVRPAPLPVPPGRLPYAGKVAAGEWLDNDDFNQDLADNTAPVSVPRYPGYPQLEQMAWRVFGDSMNQAGILEGMWLVGASYADYVDKIGELDNGNYVVVERTRYQGAERELTVKEVQFARKGMRLIPRSTNEKHKEYFIPLDTDADPDRESVRILGVVLWAGRDLAPGAK